jgi:hypothetical protein
MVDAAANLLQTLVETVICQACRDVVPKLASASNLPHGSIDMGPDMQHMQLQPSASLFAVARMTSSLGSKPHADAKLLLATILGKRSAKGSHAFPAYLAAHCLALSDLCMHPHRIAGRSATTLFPEPAFRLIFTHRRTGRAMERRSRTVLGP